MYLTIRLGIASLLTTTEVIIAEVKKDGPNPMGGMGGMGGMPGMGGMGM